MKFCLFSGQNYAQTLVSADRTSLFLVDSKTNELYARIFDIGGSLEDSKSSKLQKEIRYEFNVLKRVRFLKQLYQPTENNLLASIPSNFQTE